MSKQENTEQFQHPNLVERYGRMTWEHTEMDGLRKNQCLCLNCDKLRPGENDHCAIAQAGFKLCVEHGIAYAMTRCPEFELKKD